MSGEYIRKNITETQPGIPLTVDFQVLDTETCEPVTGAYLEIWRKKHTPTPTPTPTQS